MHPILNELLQHLDVVVTPGTNFLEDDFSEAALRNRYVHLFDLQHHSIFVLDSENDHTLVTDWQDLMNWVDEKESNIVSVIAVPNKLGEKIARAITFEPEAKCTCK